MQRLLRPLSLMIVALLVVMVGAIYYGGIMRQIDENALDLLSEQVKNRKSYLENSMVSTWSNVSITVDEINRTVEALRKTNQIDLSRLESDKQSYQAVLRETADDLVSLMRRNSVTGAYIVLSVGEIDLDAPEDKKGLYLRDLDPASNASVTNSDLLLKRGPVELVSELGITTDSDWQPQYPFANNGYGLSFYKTYHAAWVHPEIGWSDLGYWSEPYQMPGDSREAISYTVPLRLGDGTLYGVLGIEQTIEHLVKQLPSGELIDGANGSYVLGVTEDGTHFKRVLVSGTFQAQQAGNKDEIELTRVPDGADNVFQVDTDTYGCVEYLSLYNSNTPFSGQHWALIGIADEKDVFSFSRSLRWTFVLLSGVLLLFGLTVVCGVSFKLAKPIAALSADLEQADRDKPLEFRRTGIEEIDRLTGELESLSQDVFSASQKFAGILRMASVRMAGFEINKKTGSVFVTDGFFELFNLPPMMVSLTSPVFRRLLETRQDCMISHESIPPSTEECTYRVVLDGHKAYVRLRCVESDDRVIGLAEDVTAQTLERQKIEHERDHDALTGLLGRRAFERRMHELFNGRSKELRVAALLMLDLDNLKYVNDTYGHDSGDRYICSLAAALSKGTPAGTLLSRQSGDEMFVFFYGYDSEQKVRNLIRDLKRELDKQRIRLPDGSLFPVSASGGIAWYPKDSTQLERLFRYADFAMYEVKRNGKGDLGDFDMDSYRSATRLQRCREEFALLISQERIFYKWQPIVDTKTGKVFAYEGLMRSDLETLQSPKDILEVAESESQLNWIERMTLFKAMESYVDNRERGLMPGDCRIFLNSIPNQMMTAEETKRFEALYGKYLDQVVIEITEGERVRAATIERKRERIDGWGAKVALDDYGSGYNSEIVLLALSPHYVKIDMSIVRDIDTDRDKQKLVQNLISYANERRIELVAEGIETRAELETIVRMGVCYVQGYLIARPGQIPPPVPDEIAQLMREINSHGTGCANEGVCETCGRRMVCPRSDYRDT